MNNIAEWAEWISWLVIMLIPLLYMLVAVLCSPDNYGGFSYEKGLYTNIDYENSGWLEGNFTSNKVPIYLYPDSWARAIDTISIDTVFEAIPLIETPMSDSLINMFNADLWYQLTDKSGFVCQRNIIWRNVEISHDSITKNHHMIIPEYGRENVLFQNPTRLYKLFLPPFTEERYNLLLYFVIGSCYFGLVVLGMYFSID